MNLRPYQDRLANDIRSAFASGARRPLGVSPTGSGKTVLFSYITSQVLKRGARVVIVAHRREILDQISGTLSKVSVPHGFIQAGKPMSKQPAMVASIQTLGRRLEQVTTPDLVIIDDLGFAPLDDTGSDLLFRFVAAAYEHRSLGVASHWPFESWGRFLPEHTTAVALLDRLLHHATTVVTSGDSYRMKEARQRGGGLPTTTA